MYSQQQYDTRYHHSRRTGVHGRRNEPNTSRTRSGLNTGNYHTGAVFEDMHEKRSTSSRNCPYTVASRSTPAASDLIQMGYNDLSRSTSPNKRRKYQQNCTSATRQQECTSPTCMSFDGDQILDLNVLSANTDIDNVSHMVNNIDTVQSCEYTNSKEYTMDNTPVHVDTVNCDRTWPEGASNIPFNPNVKVALKGARSYPLASEKRRPRLNKSRSHLSQDTDLDMDTLVPMAVRTSCPNSTPTGVPEDYSDGCRFVYTRRYLVPFMSGKKDQTTKVYIQHRYATDSQVLGDKFGIDIQTDDSSKKDGYYRHFCKNLEPGSPADKMKISNEDELVMVHGVFAPQLNHQEIIELFSRVPVDGVKRFELVLRRKNTPAARQPMSRKWEWFETSAILVPELNEEPITKNLLVKPLPNNMKDLRTWQRYKVIGTQYFLTLGSNGVGVDVLYNDAVRDRPKLIHKHAIICEDEHDPSKMDFLVSLSCNDNTFYVSIDLMNKAVVTVKKEAFFQYRNNGPEIFFKQKDVYLNCVNNRVVAREERQFFEEFGAPGHKDVLPSSHTHDLDELDGGYVSGSPPETMRITRSMSRQASVNTMFCHMDLNCLSPFKKS